MDLFKVFLINKGSFLLNLIHGSPEIVDMIDISEFWEIASKDFVDNVLEGKNTPHSQFLLDLQFPRVASEYEGGTPPSLKNFYSKKQRWRTVEAIMFFASFVKLPGAGVFKGGRKISDFVDDAIKTIPTWKGSGPAPGVLGVNSSSKSIKAIQNYYPKQGGIEFVFDYKTNTFVVGKPIKSGFGSPHQNLADTIGANTTSAVGGSFTRGPNRKILTNEHSGHFGEYWTPEIRKQFQNTMKNYGLDLEHSAVY